MQIPIIELHLDSLEDDFSLFRRVVQDARVEGHGMCLDGLVHVPAFVAAEFFE